MTEPELPFTPGTIVRVKTDNKERGDLYSGHMFPIDTLVRADEMTGGTDPKRGVHQRFNWLDGHDYWFLFADEVEVVEDEPPARPMIDFSDAEMDRSTAREYASDLRSNVLKHESNAILQDVANGESVDAYALNAALTDAMSSCATRAAQSLARREMTKKVRHLAYIVQAVLENHADNLPAYAEGQRSRAVAEAKSALAHARVEIDNLVDALRNERQESATLKQAASDERRRLVEEIDYEKGRVAALIREKTSEELLSETLQAALTYALTLLPVEERRMVEAYEAGFSKGRSNRADT